MFLRRKALAAALAAATFATSLLGGAALGAKRITWEEAWRLCLQELADSRTYPGWVSNDRYLRGGACMYGYGYRL